MDTSSLTTKIISHCKHLVNDFLQIFLRYFKVRRADNKNPLRLEDKEVFDKSPVFKLTSHDTHRALLHTKNKQKKGERINLSPTERCRSIHKFDRYINSI